MTTEELLAAAKNMDWGQIVLNGGPPCFHLQADGYFCGRARRWDGHRDEIGPAIHAFVSFDALLERFAELSRLKPGVYTQTVQEIHSKLTEIDKRLTIIEQQTK